MKLLLDVHFSPAIGEQLRERGHDVIAAVEDPELRQVDDERLLECAVQDARALLTNDAKDFVPLAGEWERSGREHFGLVLTSDRSMPRTRAGIGQLVVVLNTLMSQHPTLGALHHQIVWAAARR